MKRTYRPVVGEVQACPSCCFSELSQTATASLAVNRVWRSHTARTTFSYSKLCCGEDRRRATASASARQIVEIHSSRMRPLFATLTDATYTPLGKFLADAYRMRTCLLRCLVHDRTICELCATRLAARDRSLSDSATAPARQHTEHHDRSGVLAPAHAFAKQTRTP